MVQTMVSIWETNSRYVGATIGNGRWKEFLNQLQSMIQFPSQFQYQQIELKNLPYVVAIFDFEKSFTGL